MQHFAQSRQFIPHHSGPGCRGGHDTIPLRGPGPDVLGKVLPIARIGQGVGHAGDGKDVRSRTVPERGQKALGRQAVGEVESMIAGGGQVPGQGGTRQNADLCSDRRKNGLHKSL